MTPIDSAILSCGIIGVKYVSIWHRMYSKGKVIAIGIRTAVVLVVVYVVVGDDTA
ncbi:MULTISPECIES: hypothetical protein [unclassified Bacillus cereus group]|uniref:hypothetical protein n=1 Tax=unclassified Bacillus cereus group TaxID=2750818 RepID=UPI001F56B542|nr:MULTISPECIES: hypothetical protein [unclassified Bacillus cereus group]MDA1593064.1 hypothetical protein [Bacillus cereus group sp. TH225LC]